MSATKRTYVICHMMSTIEGKITSGTGVDILEDYFDLYTKTEDTYKAKAWLLGRITAEMFADTINTKIPSPKTTSSTSDFIAEKQSDYYLFVVDTKGKLRWKDNTITFSNIDDKLNLVVIVTNKTPKSYLAYLQKKNISYIFGGKNEVDFAFLFEKVKSQFEIDKIILEGGGILNGSVIHEDLIDEISLLVTPLVLNRSAAPCVFERSIHEKVATKRFHLSSVQKLEDDAVWLRYKRTISPGG